MIEINVGTVLSVVVTVVIGILAYFCKRLIDQNDKSFEKVTAEFKEVDKKMSTRFDTLDNKFSKLENKIHVSNTALAVLEEKVERIEDNCPMGKVP